MWQISPATQGVKQPLISQVPAMIALIFTRLTQFQTVSLHAVIHQLHFKPPRTEPRWLCLVCAGVSDTISLWDLRCRSPWYSVLRSNFPSRHLACCLAMDEWLSHALVVNICHLHSFCQAWEEGDSHQPGLRGSLHPAVPHAVLRLFHVADRTGRFGSWAIKFEQCQCGEYLSCQCITPPPPFLCLFLNI